MVVQTDRDLIALRRMFARMGMLSMATRDEQGREYRTVWGVRLEDLDLPRHGRDYPDTRVGADELLDDLQAFIGTMSVDISPAKLTPEKAKAFMGALDAAYYSMEPYPFLHKPEDE